MPAADSEGNMKIKSLTILAKFFITAVFCFGLFSCAGREVLKPELQPHEGPVSLNVLRQSVGFGDVKSIKAFADVTVFRKDVRQSSLNGIFAYKAPGNMRINLFGPFGLTATEILISDEIIQIFVPSRNVLYEGASPGVSFTRAMNGNFVYEMREEHDGYSLIGRSSDPGSPLTVYYFDRRYLLNRSMAFFRNGSGLMETEFSEFSGRVPGRMRLALANGLNLDIKLKEPEFDTQIDDAYFRSIEHENKQVKSFQEIFQLISPTQN
jgi:outer membrane lipoprotein-sorting protein